MLEFSGVRDIEGSKNRDTTVFWSRCLFEYCPSLFYPDRMKLENSYVGLCTTREEFSFKSEQATGETF